MTKDYIDFPCSDDWLEYYYERGLTPRKPQKNEHPLIRRIEKLEEENSRLLTLLLKHLEQEDKEYRERADGKIRVLNRF